MHMNLSTFLALRNPVLNFCNYLSNGALLSYKNMCICYGKHLLNRIEFNCMWVWCDPEVDPELLSRGAVDKECAYKPSVIDWYGKEKGHHISNRGDIPVTMRGGKWGSFPLNPPLVWAIYIKGPVSKQIEKNFVEHHWFVILPSTSTSYCPPYLEIMTSRLRQNFTGC